jgi:hypothetical protein
VGQAPDSGAGTPSRPPRQFAGHNSPGDHCDEADRFPPSNRQNHGSDTTLAFSSRSSTNFRETRRDFASLRWHQGCLLP